MDSPAAFSALVREAEQLGFPYSSEPLTGMLLRALAASKPGGRFLEIGTGVGVGTCWLLDGMDVNSALVTIELDAQVSAIAQKHLGRNARVMFINGSAEDFLRQKQAAKFDLIFADTFPGKFYLLDEALDLLNVGGLYVIDDLLPQPTWGDDHAPKVERLIATLEARADLRTARLEWASGIMVCTKVSV